MWLVTWLVLGDRSNRANAPQSLAHLGNFHPQFWGYEKIILAALEFTGHSVRHQSATATLSIPSNQRPDLRAIQNTSQKWRLESESSNGSPSLHPNLSLSVEFDIRQTVATAPHPAA
jgi:hypothetical protein